MLHSRSQSLPDPEDPDVRPISIAQIVRPHRQNSVSSTNYTIPRQLPQVKVGLDTLPPLASYSPPSAPDSARSKSSFNHFLKSSRHIDHTVQEETRVVQMVNDNTPPGLLAKSFLHNYILDKTADVEALIIQNAWRLSRRRNRFKRWITFILKQNFDRKRFFFIAWSLLNSRRTVPTQNLKKRYHKILLYYPKFKTLLKNREVSPFGLYYITNQILLPVGYDAKRLFNYVYAMTAHYLKEVLVQWGHAAAKRKEHFKTLNYIRFTQKKQKCYGPIYLFFQNWHRFSAWKKLARSHGANKSTESYITLAATEPNIIWRILESTMNAKRIRIARASEFSRKRIASNAVRAIFNLSIQCYSKQAINEQADIFYNQHLQALAHRAWLHYMQKNSQYQQIYRDVMNSWYKYVYKVRQYRNSIQLSENLQKDSHVLKIMNQWYKVSQISKLIRIRMELSLQQTPSLILSLIFLLRGDYELYFSTQCFRFWIRFVRARKRWKNFVRWSAEPDENKETSHLVLCELRRASLIKLVQRIFVSETHFFPRKVLLSLEMTLRAIDEVRRNDEISSKHHWNFETEVAKKSKPPPFTSSTLIRLFLVRVHQRKNFDLCKFENDPFAVKSGNPFFEKFRTLDDLVDQVTKNKEIFQERISLKIRRDQSVLAGMVSHITANQFKDISPSFTTQETFSFVKSKDYDKQHSDNKVVVYPDYMESIDKLIKEAEGMKARIPPSFDTQRDQSLRAFGMRLRDPNRIQNRSSSVFLSTLNNLGHQANKLSKAFNTSSSKNSRICKFVKPSSIEHIEEDNAMMELLAGVKFEKESGTLFDIDRIKLTLARTPQLDEYLSSMVKFVYELAKVNLDVSTTYHLTKINDFGGDCEHMKKHSMMRNIAVFLAEMAGYTDLTQIPVKVNAPMYATDAVSAVMTIHAALKKSPLNQYIGCLPFMSKIKTDDPITIITREKLWNAAKVKYPKLDDPTNTPFQAQISVGSLSKLRQMSTNSFHQSSSALFTIGGGNQMEDAINNQEAFIACTLLPFALSLDSVTDFANDEIIARIQTAQGKH